MASEYFKPTNRFSSWDDCKEDYLLWEKEYEAEHPYENDFPYGNEIGWLTFKFDTEYKDGFDKNSRVSFYALEDGDLYLFSKDKVLMAVVKDISDEQLEDFEMLLPLGDEVQKVTL